MLPIKFYINFQILFVFLTTTASIIIFLRLMNLMNLKLIRIYINKYWY